MGRWSKEPTQRLQKDLKGRAGCYRLSNKQKGDSFLGSILQQLKERGGNAAFQSPECWWELLLSEGWRCTAVDEKMLAEKGV